MEQHKCARLEARNGEAVMLKGVKMTGDLRGPLFEASVEQCFCNPTDTNIEVVLAVSSHRRNLAVVNGGGI